MATKQEMQDQINALGERLGATAAGLRADVDKLKADAAAGVELDFGPVANRVALLEGLDAENPTATPVVPADEPAPVPDSGSEPAPVDGGTVQTDGGTAPVEPVPTPTEGAPADEVPAEPAPATDDTPAPPAESGPPATDAPAPIVPETTTPAGPLMGTPASGIVSGEPQGDTGAPNQG